MSLTLCAGSLNQGKMIALEQAYTWLGPETAFSVWMLEFMLENLGIEKLRKWIFSILSNVCKL